MPATTSSIQVFTFLTMSLRDRIAALDSELLTLKEVEIAPSRSSTPALQTLDHSARKESLGTGSPARNSPKSTAVLDSELQNLRISTPSPRSSTPVRQSLDSLGAFSTELQNLKESEVEIVPIPRVSTPVSRQTAAQPNADHNYRKEALETSTLARQGLDWTYRKEAFEDTTPVRHSLDHRFDSTAPSVDARPAPTPAYEKSNPFDTNSNPNSDGKQPFYDSIAASFGLGILDTEDFTEFNIYNAFVTNLRICPVHLTDSGRYYYVEHRFWLPSVPGVVLHRGNDKEGEVLGVAHIPIQGENSIGVGDFKNVPERVVWERMGNAGFWTHQRYDFSYWVERQGESEGGQGGERKTFQWIRTRNNLIDDQGDLVLVEKGKDEVLAEYLGKGVLKWKKRGRLRVKNMEREFGETWELVVLTSWASVVEVSRIPFLLSKR